MIIVDQPERCGKWLAEKQNNIYCKDESSVYIASERKGKLNVVIMYNNYIPNGSIYLHIAVEGMGNKEIRWFAFYYPFIQLKIKKIIALVQSNNKKCINLALKAGFVCENIIENAGSNGDLWLLTVTKDQCRFLK